MLFVFCGSALAGQVHVSEQDGSGDWISHGFVEIFDATSNTAASLYSYGTPCTVSYSGTLFAPSVDKSTVAIVDTQEGTTLFVVHDSPSQASPCPYQAANSTEGSASVFFDLYYDTDGMMDCLVKDGPPPENGDVYSGCGSSRIYTDQSWVASRTDGVVLGTLDGGVWRLEIWSGFSFPTVRITEVVVKSGDGNDVTLTNTDPAIRLDAVLNVDIDVKPGSDPNCFNINGKGVIPVAILGSDSFDVSMVDQSALSFGGMQVRVRGNKGPFCGLEDTNADGFDDLVCQFQDDPLNWTPGDGSATLTGMMLDTTVFAGTDTICVVP